MLEKTKEEDALASQIENHRAKLTEMVGRLKAMKLARAGVAVGDWVVHRGRRLQVTEVKPGGTKAWVKVRRMKLDGTQSKVEENLYDVWEHAPSE